MLGGGVGDIDVNKAARLSQKKEGLLNSLVWFKHVQATKGPQPLFLNLGRRVLVNSSNPQAPPPPRIPGDPFDETEGAARRTLRSGHGVVVATGSHANRLPMIPFELFGVFDSDASRLSSLFF